MSKFIDLTGNFYGIYEVIKRGEDYIVPKTKACNTQWWIRCTKCKAKKLILAGHLKDQKNIRCTNCPQLKIGKRYNKWLEPIERVEDHIDPKSGHRYQQFKIKCHYGAEGCRGTFVTRALSILRGVTSSCGCYQRKKAKLLNGQRKGKDSSNWQGGVTKLQQQIRNLPEYTEWRELVFKRDNYICQYSGRGGKNLCVHHIKAFSTIMKENNITTIEKARSCKEFWNISNGVTLSEKWHKGIKTLNLLAFHRIFGWKTFTEKNFWNWMETRCYLTITKIVL